jgi:hypothetical protein
MSKVTCEVEEVQQRGDYGRVWGVEVACTKCGHITESHGTGGASIRRCLAMMREECPEGENNFYVAEGSEE